MKALGIPMLLCGIMSDRAFRCTEPRAERLFEG